MSVQSSLRDILGILAKKQVGRNEVQEKSNKIKKPLRMREDGQSSHSRPAIHVVKRAWGLWYCGQIRFKIQNVKK